MAEDSTDDKARKPEPRRPGGKTKRGRPKGTKNAKKKGTRAK
jgi:hypothetical protein